MWRSVLGILGGIVAGSLVVGLIELPGYLLHPLPAGFDLNDQAALIRHYAQAPLAAQVLVSTGWFVGPFVATLIAAWVARRRSYVQGAVIGAVFLSFVAINLGNIPHPPWMRVVGIIAPCVGSALGAFLAGQLFRQRPGAGPQPYDMRAKKMAC